MARSCELGLLDPERTEIIQRKLQAQLRFQERKQDPRLARELKDEWKRIHKAMRHNKPGRT